MYLAMFFKVLKFSRSFNKNLENFVLFTWPCKASTLFSGPLGNQLACAMTWKQAQPYNKFVYLLILDIVFLRLYLDVPIPIFCLNKLYPSVVHSLIFFSFSLILPFLLRWKYTISVGEKDIHADLWKEILHSHGGEED